MNKIPVGGELYEIGFTVKIPFTRYWMAWLKEICVFEIVCKYFEPIKSVYFFNRVGHNYWLDGM